MSGLSVGSIRPPGTIEVFFSYSKVDKDLRAELEKQLAVLSRSRAITGWYDRTIDPGVEWEPEIMKHLNSARLILLLISPDFLATDYCYEVEMTRAMERHAEGEACVIPVILRDCLWEDAPFATLECLPEKGKPVTSWPNRDEGFVNVARGVKKAVLGLLQQDLQKNLLLQAAEDEKRIDAQIAADAQKPRAERWKIMQDLQSKIFEITEDITVNKARKADDAFKAMDDYIRG